MCDNGIYSVVIKMDFTKKLNVKLHYIRLVFPECDHCVSHGILAQSEYFSILQKCLSQRFSKHNRVLHDVIIIFDQK